MSEHFKVSDTMPLATPEARKVWVNFVPNVDLGHILTMVSFASALAVTWNLQDRRITVAEQKQAASEAQLAEVKSVVKDIQMTLTQIQITLAVQGTLNNTRPGK